MSKMIFSPKDEADLVGILHDRTMSKTGPDAAIARGAKEIMPVFTRWLVDEIMSRRVTQAELVLIVNHLVVSLQMSAFLTATGGPASLAPVIDTLVEHAKERLDAAAEEVKRHTRGDA